jgi:hypothetical protein
VTVSGAGRIFCAGSMVTTADGQGRNAVVVSYPPVDEPVWTGADGIWRYDGPAAGYETFYGLLRVSDGEIYAAGRRAGAGGGQAMLHRLAMPVR